VARLLFVFLDGVGLGASDPTRNPFALGWPGLTEVAGVDWTAAAWSEASQDQRVRRGLDARLGTPGIPQSATGQTTLLTGRNAVAVMGRHYGPWPGPTLRTLLAHGSLFSDARSSGGACLANAYPAAYRDALAAAQRPDLQRQRSSRRWRPSAPVVAALHAGLPLADVAALVAGEAVAADLHGAALLQRRGDAEPPSGAALGPEAQAEALLRLAQRHAFTFFDVWGTDRAGHAQDVESARGFVARLERFLLRLVGQLPADVTLVVTSDHGNLEDLSSPRHTLAPVPLLAIGPHAHAFGAARSLLDVAPAARRVIATP